jgi:membrane protease YdiL (CAAX protease family)
MPEPIDVNLDATSEPDLEWDDTPTSLFLRALFTLLAGGFLAWAQWRAPVRAGMEWNRWIALSGVANLLLPLGIIWMFFAQGVRRVPWLRNQALNAWNYGWDFRDWRTHIRWSLALFVLSLPFLWFASRDPATRNYYQQYLPAIGGFGSLFWLLATLVIYMFCWEWFFRGFLLFGMAQGFGFVVAIVLQAIVFGMAHSGKPSIEYFGSFAGGLVLGIIAWRQRSFATAFYTHALVHIAWAILVLYL